MSDKKYDGWLVSDSLIKRSMALIIFASLLKSCV